MTSFASPKSESRLASAGGTSENMTAGVVVDRIPPLLAAADKAAAAGSEVLLRRFEDHKKSPLAIVLKDDDSPVTAADEESDAVIRSILAEMTGIPVVSEEKEMPYEARRLLSTFWLVDPLDGTRNFLNRDGEFAVNIALIHNGRPIVGVIAVPTLGISYHAAQNLGAVRRGPEGAEKISCAEKPTGIWLGSKQNDSPSARGFYRENGITENRIIRVGASLKYCLIAEGKADGYVHPEGNSEWDTAPGDLILAEAGGIVVDYGEASRLAYNKVSMRNAGFIAYAPGVDVPGLKRP